MRPPVINTKDSLQQRYDMCYILLDMFETNETIRRVEIQRPKKLVPYSADSHYDTLKADLSLIDGKSDEFKAIKNYFDNTKSSYSATQLLNVWSVGREGEPQRHKKFEKLDNRRLLWHETSIAVVAPIITSGLRTMPHRRVGSGIYLASMQEKSAQYTRGCGSKLFASMFLCEGALGKSHKITSDGPHAYNLKKASKGFDSVHDVGARIPASWSSTTIDGKSVGIPHAKAKSSGITSSFGHDKILVYDEAQIRLRYSSR